MRKIDVLVTGAEERQGLAVIRALGSKGLNVCAAGSKQGSFGFLSRYAKARCTYPSPIFDKKGFCEAILDAVNAYDIPMVIPVVESTVIALDEYRDRFKSRTQLALPDANALEHALDKQKTYDLAESLGVTAPRTCYPSSSQEVLDFARETGFPLIAKPRAFGSYSKAGGSFNFKVLYLPDMAALEKAIGMFEQQGAFPMIQQFCQGLSVPQSLLCASGSILGICQHRRGRDYPLSGGVASVVISEPVDPQLRDWTEKLMQALQWDGIAQVEYRVDPTTGQKFLFEINGRIWAPVSAAIQWGLNYPYALYRYLRFGEASPMASSYPMDQRCRYLRGDLIALEGHLFGANTHSVVPLPGKMRVAWDMLKDFRPGVQSDTWDWADLLPSIYETFVLAGRYTIRTALNTARLLARKILKR